MKTFSDLARLRKELAALEEARRDEERRARAERARRDREARLFHDEVSDAVPLKPGGRVSHARPSASTQPLQRQRDEREALLASISDDIDIERLLETDEALSYRRAGVGPDVVRRLRRGEWVVQAQIDLHGLRVDEAREALAEFLNGARKRGQRCVRIIHGKGLGSANREPVLKHKVLKWLVQRTDVLAFCQTRPDDGGSGALLALLQSTPLRQP